MSIVNTIKNFFIKKRIPRIEAIKTYEDVNLFLAGYKYYFEKIDAWYFIIRDNHNDHILLGKAFDGFFIPDLFEPNIRAFVWEHKDSINAELLRRNKSAEISNRIRLQKEALEKEIKNNLFG